MVLELVKVDEVIEVDVILDVELALGILLVTLLDVVVRQVLGKRLITLKTVCLKMLTNIAFLT